MVNEGELAGAAGIKIALENIGGEIVFARDRFEGRAPERARLSNIHRAFPPLALDDFSSNRNSALAFCLSMILSKNLFPPRIKSGAGLLRIMLWRAGYCPPLAHATHYAVNGIWSQLRCQICCEDGEIAL